MDLSFEDIKKFSDLYNKNENNKKIENEITNQGLYSSCINEKNIAENDFSFNLELEDGYRYNQKNNDNCWIYAGFNMIKYNMASNLNIDVKNLVLSNTYLSFYAKLEQSNFIYEEIINTECKDIEKIKNNFDIVINNYGFFEFFSYLVRKYGIVPEAVMQDTFESGISFTTCQILNEKVMTDISELLVLKEQGKSIEELTSKKICFLEENYSILSKIYHEPIQKFDFKYINKNGVEINLSNITPIEFKEKYLSLNLEDFITIGNIPKYDKEFNKKYYTPYWGMRFEYLNLTINEIKELCQRQLTEKIPVYIGGYVFKHRSIKDGVLDINLFDFEKLLGIRKISKETMINFSTIKMHHFMTIEGMNIGNNKIQRWKIEDSFGRDYIHDGYYIMNDNFFDDYVLCAVINKKYLSDSQKELLINEAKLCKRGLF